MDKIRSLLFKNNTFGQTIAKNTFWAAFGTLTAKIIRFLVIVYVARIIGVEGYGIYTYAFALVCVLMIFSDVGLSTITTRELVHLEDAEKKNFLSTALLLKIGLITLALIASLLLAPVISNFKEANSIIFILSLSIVFESLRSFFYSVIRSDSKMEIEAGITIFNEVAITVFIFTIFSKDPTPKTLAWSYVFGNSIGLLAILYFLKFHTFNIFKHIKKTLILPIIKNSWPLAIVSAFGIFMTNIDSVLIGIFNNKQALGLYGVAQKSINLLYLVPGFLVIGIFPILNKLIKNGNQAKLVSVVKKSLTITTAISMPIVFGGILIADKIIYVLFGEQFIEGAIAFKILLFSLLFVFPGSILSNLLIAKNRQNIFIKSSFFGAMTNILLDLILIPTYGIAGSAVATVISLLIVNYIFYLEGKKICKFSIKDSFKKILFSVIIMTFVVYFLSRFDFSLSIIIFVAVIIYFVSLHFLKESIPKEFVALFQENKK